MPSRQKTTRPLREVQLELPGCGYVAGKDQFSLDVTGLGEPSGSLLEGVKGGYTPFG